jgi:hypothetical protein
MSTPKKYTIEWYVPVLWALIIAILTWILQSWALGLLQDRKLFHAADVASWIIWGLGAIAYVFTYWRLTAPARAFNQEQAAAKPKYEHRRYPREGL